MDLLIQLLSVDAPPGTRLQSAELHFRGLIPWWLAAILLVVLGAAVVTLYLRERARLGILSRLTLASLRIGLIALLLFLLSRPIVLAEFEGTRRRGVVLLLDNSLSMSQRDRRMSHEDQARAALILDKQALDARLSQIRISPDLPRDPARKTLAAGVLRNPELSLLKKLDGVGPLRTAVFGSYIRGVQEEGDSGDPAERLLADFKATDSSTALADSLLAILDRKDGDPPAAIVAITDGRDNASKYTLSEAGERSAALGISIHIYGVGSSDGGRLRLREVGVPKTVFAEDSVTLPIHWSAHGLKQGTLEVIVTLDGKQVAKKDVRAGEGDDIRDSISFTVPKAKEGEETLKLKTSVALKGNDTFQDAFEREVRVLDRKIKVLVVEHSPRFEYKFLQAALLRDRRVEPTFVLVQADPQVARSGPPFLEEFPKQRDKFFDARYNAIVLGDVSVEDLTKEQLEWVREFVAAGGGLVVISGRQHMPNEYAGSPLAEVLPVEFAPTKAKLPTNDRTPEYPPTLTDAGLRSPMLSLADTPEESRKLWSRLPGFYANFPITKLRPGAQALVVNPRAKLDDKPMPIVVSHHYGKGEVVFLATDETWRWRANVENKHFVRFWGQILYQLGLPSLLGSSSSRAQMALEHGDAILDRPGSLFVRLLDKDFHPRTDARVMATLEYLDAPADEEKNRKIELQRLAGRDGEYQGFLPHDRPGRYVVRIDDPDPASFFFRVELPPRHELEETGMAENELRSLAEQTAGRFYREEDLHRLPGDVRPQEARFVRRQELLLWNPLMFLVFLGLITAEWMGRKFANLI